MQPARKVGIAAERRICDAVVGAGLVTIVGLALHLAAGGLGAY